MSSQSSQSHCGQTLDLISIVEELNGLSSKEVTKLLKDSENFTIQCNSGKGSVIQVDMERLATSLPLHLIAVLLSTESKMPFTHLLRGVRLLHVMSDVASRHPRIEQLMLDDVKISEQLIDLVFFMLIVLAQAEQDYGRGTSVPPLHSTLVACTLYLLTGYISSQWHELVHVLLAHPKVDIFMDVAFDAVHADIRLLHVELSALACKTSSLPAGERVANFLCLQREVSLQFLLSLCQQKLFRDRLLKNKELCRAGGILSLCHAVLKLKLPESFIGSLGMAAAVSRLKSKALSILLQLCEAESVSYLDEVAGSSKSMSLAKSVALEILDLLKAAFGKEAKKIENSLDRSNPKGLVLLNSLRLADIYSDDSNFRSFFMTFAIQVLVEILAIPHEEFQSSWCSANVPMVEEDPHLEYDPFNAAGVALIFLAPDCVNDLSAPVPSIENNFSCHFNFTGAMPSVTYAQQKASYLVKIIANLHCFVPNICEEEERNLFLNKFRECLLTEASESLTHPSNFKAHKAATICENLSSLSNHAMSLIPNLLNDEDVNLLRVFTDQLKKLIPSQIGNSWLQEPVVKDVDGTTIKVENLHPLHQPLPNWTKISNPNYRKINQDSQRTCGGAPSTSGRLDASSQGETPNFNGGLDQHITTTKPEDQPDRIAYECSVAELLRGFEKQNQKFETMGIEQNFIKGDVDAMSDSRGTCKAEDYTKENGCQDDEKVDGVQGEEKQPRKRKRNIMNEKQVNLIEKALLDEPEMQRNSASLQLWADTLSAQGSEITHSQLKNWLNNRKAKLARIAREARASSEGENTYPDNKTCGPTSSHYYESPDSANDEPYIPPSRPTPLGPHSVPKCSIPNSEFTEISRYNELNPGQLVMVLDAEGNEMGMGKVFQVEGRWQGKNLEDAGVCIVDVTELKVERSREVQYPSDGGGRTFEEAFARNGGVARVAWDLARLQQLPSSFGLKWEEDEI